MVYSGGGEPSSSFSFTSSSHISNGSTCHNMSGSPASGSETGSSLEIISLNKLSCNLELLLIDESSGYTDAIIMVEGVPVGVHRCILAARSKFFHDFFKNNEEQASSEKNGSGKPKYNMNDTLPYGKVGCEAFRIFLSYLYTGKLKPSPPDVSTCVDNGCPHDACRPAIDFAVELMYASAIFQVPELVSLFQRRLLNFVGKALVEDVIPILVVSFHCQLDQLVAQCVDRIARSDLGNVAFERELPYEVAEKIKSLKLKNKQDDECENVAVDPLREKRIRRIYKALDSDDVELVKLLLTESEITLDEACALHYAVAYCDPKVVKEVLALHLADVNLQNDRGFTVLHVAARRKEPSIIVALLSQGACASEPTWDGQTAVSICRRLTRPKDYNAKTEQGQEANKDKLCIDVLEREVRRNPLAGDSTVFSPNLADDLHMKLLYLENRVAFARLLFPTEAKLAMEIAHAETTLEFSGLSRSKDSSGKLRKVDLNETPITLNKRVRSRMEALQKTVETGRRYFPNCSQVLDKFMEDDLLDLFYLEKGSLEEQKIKRMRFMELKEDVEKAFHKDRAEINRSGLSSVSSASSLKDGAYGKGRK